MTFFKDLTGSHISAVLGNIILILIIYFYHHLTKSEKDLFEHFMLIGLIASFAGDYFLGENAIPNKAIGVILFMVARISFSVANIYNYFSIKSSIKTPWWVYLLIVALIYFLF